MTASDEKVRVAVYMTRRLRDHLRHEAAYHGLTVSALIVSTLFSQLYGGLYDATPEKRKR